MFACIYTYEIHEALADFAYAFSPLVELTNPNTVVIDIHGCELLFGSAYGLANEVAARSLRAESEGGLGCRVNVALAANPDAAIHVATNLKGVTFVAPGEELTSIGNFSLALLNYSLLGIEQQPAEVMFETLRLWGVRTFKDLVTLPLSGLCERLGQDGIRLQQLAAGRTERHLNLKQPAQTFAYEIELDHPLTELEPLSFIFARLLNQLCASLNAFALATNELQVEMRLEDQTTHRRMLTLPYPMRNHNIFLKLLLLDTEMHSPQAPVMSVSITGDPVKPQVMQNGLFIPLVPAPDKLELTLARLTKLVGEENVGSPTVLDTNRPDAFAIKRFVLQTKSTRKRQSKDANQPSTIDPRQALGFRVFRPPLRAVVQADHGWPQHVSAWGKQRSVYGKVVQLAGPWRTTGDWWTVDSWCRDEWDIALESKGRQVTSHSPQLLYRIYRELDSGTWFVEGSYD